MQNAGASEPPPSPTRPELTALIQEFGRTAQYQHRFAQGNPPFKVGQDILHALRTDERGAVSLRLSDGDPNAATTGQTGGYSIRLPDELEAAASGQSVVIRIIARSADGPISRFACSYSTNDVGNSGWCWRVVGSEWAVHVVPYNVPPMKNGNGDFVGLLPPPAGEPAVEIAGLAIDVVARPEL